MRPIDNPPAVRQAFLFGLAAVLCSATPFSSLHAQRGAADAPMGGRATTSAFATAPRLRAALPSGSPAARGGVFAQLFSGSLIKSVTDLNGGNVMPGDSLEYVISATNIGTHDALFTILYDKIPANATYLPNSLRILSGPNAGAKSDATSDDQAQYDVAAQQVRFRLGVGATGSKNGTLAPGASTSLRFKVTINAGTAAGTVISNIGTITFTDTVDKQFEITQPSLPPGGLPTGEPTTITVTIPDLTIAKSHSGTFLRGQAGTYTLSVRNAGNAPTTAPISFSDILPAGLAPTAASGTGWTCSIVAQTVSCNHAGPAAAGATLPPVTLAVNVSNSAPASLTNTATVSGGGEINTANNSATDPTAIADPAIDLAISKTATSPTFTVGSNATYTLHVANVSAFATTGPITVSDILPAGLTFVSTSAAAWSCAASAGTVTCTHPGPLAGGASLPDIALTVAVGAAAAPSVTNTATVSTAGDVNTTNDASAATSPVSAPAAIDLAIAKSHSGTFTVGSTHAFSLTVSNVGTLATTGPVTVTDVLPTGLTYNAAAGSGWSCSNAGVTVTCTNAGPIAVGASTTITLTVSVAAAAFPAVTNSASVSTAGDANAGNDIASDPVTVTAPDLAIVKAATSAFVVGSNATYSLTVNNASATATTGTITVTDVLPSGLTFISAAGSGWSCSHAAGTVSCTTPGPVVGNATLPAVTLSVAVGAGAVPSASNTASVSTPGDLNAANDASTVSTPVTTAPVIDLAIAKSHSGTFTVGSNGVYSIAVRNAGSTATTGAITVTDNLPAGLSFVSGSGSAWSCSAAGAAVTCTNAGPLAPGATTVITLTVGVSASAIPSVTNTATVATPGDATAANNSASDPTSVASPIDLAIVKTATTPFAVGQNATYALDVTNVGTSATAGPITVNDVLPTGLTYLSAAGSGFTCAAVGQSMTCTSPGVIAAGQGIRITLTVSVASAAAPSVTNTATVSTAGDANPANNSSSVSSTVGSGIDLALSKLASTLVTGVNGTFTIGVANVGTQTTTGSTTVNDNLAPGLTFVSGSGAGFTCAASGQLVTCTRTAPLAPDQSASITITVAVSAPSGTPIVNTATVATPGDTNLPNNTASVGPVTVGTPAPDLAITKSVSGVVMAGSNATFNIGVQNVGPGVTTAPIVVTDVLQSGLTFVSGNGTGWSCQAIGQVVSCTNAGSLAPGAATTLQLVVAVAPSVTSVANTAIVSTAGDTNSANNSATTGSVSTSAAPDLSISKVAVGPFSVGQPASYTLTVTNVGSVPTGGVIAVTDNLPASLQFVSATGAGWNCSVAGQLVTCTNNGPLMAGANSSITLTVMPTSAAAPSVTNTATVTTPGDTNGGNNSASAQTPVGGTIDLALDKTGPDSVVVGGQATYVLAVRNVGTVAVGGTVTVVDTLPPGLTFQSASGTGFSCNATGVVVTCTRSTPPLQPGETATVTLNALVSAGASAPVLNRACVATAGDPAAANNCDTATSGISGAVDLVMTKDVAGALVIGQQGRFTLGVRNVGSAPAAPLITVVDTLPAGLGFLSASGNEWMCAAVGNAVTCLRSSSLAPGATSTIELNVSVSAQAVPGITNCARVSGSNESENTLNNTSCVTVPVAGFGVLELDKRVSKTEVQVGDAADYTVTVKNTGAGDVTDAVVSDTLPVGFSYEARSARLGRSSIADPAGAPGPVLTFTVGRIARGTSITLSYRVRIGAAARAGVSTNVAVAMSPGAGVASSRGTASTRVIAGFFQERGAIVGKVYTQCNCASTMQENGEVGIPGVRVFLEDGSSAVTDVEGKYSFYNVASRLHVVKIDRATLPEGAVLTPLGSRNAGDGYSRFADVKMGELHKADFAEGSGSSEVLRRVIERRRGGEVNAAGDRPVASTYPESEGPVTAPKVPRDTLRGESRVAYDLANERGIVGTTMLAAPPLHPKGPNGGESQAYSPLLGNRTLTDRNSQLPVTPLAARERRTLTPSAPGRLEVGVTPQAIPADGQTLVPVYINILDAAGEPVKVTTGATLESSLGRWLDATALETANQGLQVTLKDGHGAFYLVAPGEPGRGELRVTTDFGEVTLPLTFVASARQLTATGLFNARVDLRALLSGNNAVAPDADGFEEALRDWSVDRNDDKLRASARGALFLKGRIAGDRLLTLAYDSERDRGRTYFRDIRPDEFYPTYGDGALREFDAQSRRRFYARLDNGTSYTMFGDFQTARADERRVLSAYDRTLNGAVQHLEGARGQATLFASQGRARQVVDELPGRGISGPYALTRAEGLVNSERVEIITRDRNQPSVILSRTTMTRFADYTIEALTGRIIFRNPIPSADANLNPVSIRVTYEAESAGGEKFWVYGGDASWRLTSRLEVGGTYARDENPLQLTQLAGVNATATLAAGTFLMGEWARTGVGVVNGNAARIELRHLSDKLEGRAFAARSDADFSNTSSTFYGGRTEFGGRFSARLDSTTRLIGEALHTEDNVREAERNGVLLAVERQLSRAWRAEFGYRYAKESGVLTPGQSTLAPVDRDVSALRGRLTWTLPQQTRSALFAEYEQDVREASHRGALGGEYLLSNRARLYGRHEWLTGVEGAYATNLGRSQQYTVFGMDADYLKNTRMFSEYRGRDAFNGRDAEASIGLRNRWALGPGLIVNTSVERVSPLHAVQPSDALAVTGGVEWTRPSLWKSTARLEFRNADTGDNMLGSFGYARKLTRDWTFLGRTLWDVADIESKQTRGWSQLGFAWRQTDRNRWNAVMRYENKVEHMGAVTTTPTTETVAHILAALVNVQPTERLTLSGRYAAKSARDEVGIISSRSTAQLLMGRGIFDLNRRLDAGIIGSLLATDGLSSRQYGLGGEVGLLVMKNLRIAGGYNLFGFTDKDLNSFGTTRKGAYLELGFKFDESLFGVGGNATPCESACRSGTKEN